MKEDDRGEKIIGLISEESPKAFSDGTSIYMDRYNYYLLGGMKGLILENEDQQKKIEEQENEIENLKKRLEILEQSKGANKPKSFWNKILGK